MLEVISEISLKLDRLEKDLETTIKELKSSPLGKKILKAKILDQIIYHKNLLEHYLKAYETL